MNSINRYIQTERVTVSRCRLVSGGQSKLTWEVQSLFQISVRNPPPPNLPKLTWEVQSLFQILVRNPPPPNLPCYSLPIILCECGINLNSSPSPQKLLTPSHILLLLTWILPSLPGNSYTKSYITLTSNIISSLELL